MSYRQAIVAAFVALVTLTPAAAMAQSETVLHSYWPRSGPYAAPLEDPAGALFVPTYSGLKWGDVTRVSDRQGVWKKRTVFTFDGGDGENPSGGLIQDPNGVLYGLTNFGGTHGYGTIYSLSRAEPGWNEAALYDFTGGADGGQPRGALVRDKATGIVYGTADGGGGAGCGTAFALTPSGGAWSYGVLYNFAGGNDGCYPSSGLHEDSRNGTLFGATAGGGGANDGTVFQLTQSNGVWSESILYGFRGGNDGIYPVDIIADTAGHLLGVASGGAYGAGIVFELSKIGHDWQQSVLYSFTGSSDGGGPVGLQVEPSTGIVFGTTQYGGSTGYGTVFKLVSNGSSWTESVLYSFGATKGDGRNPASRPVEDSATGVLYGTTSAGGDHNGGTLYQITQ